MKPIPLPSPDVPIRHPGTGVCNKDWYDFFRGAGRGSSFGTSFVNVEDFGAAGDTVTDDTVAIQKAIDSIEDQFGGGIIYFPPGVYLVTSTIVVSASIMLLGASVNECSLMTRNDVTVLRVDGNFALIMNMTIIGKGSNSDTGAFGATVAAAIMNGVESRMLHVRIQGGAPCVQCDIDDVFLEDVILLQSLGDTLCQVNAVTFVSRCKFDQQWPISLPAFGTTFANWAASTAYPVGRVVKITQAGTDWYIQCMTAGTSAGSQPALKNYDVDIVDGSAVWRLVSKTTMDGIVVTADEFHGTSTDISGVGRYGIIFVNTARLGFLDHFIIGQQWTGSVLLDSGSDVYIDQCELNAGLNPDTAAVTIGSGWGGNTSITGCTIFGTVGSGGVNEIGVDIRGSGNTRISDNYFRTCAAGVFVRPNVSNFIISANSFGQCTRAVDVQAGTSNFYNIVNNLVNTSGAIVDNGTGVNKTLTGNV